MATKKAVKRRFARAPKTLGELVRTVREAESLTLEAMGQRLGTSRGTLCDVEHGRRAISAALAARWADELGYEPRTFVALALQADIDAAGLGLRVAVR